MLTPTTTHAARQHAQLLATNVSVTRGGTAILNHLDLSVAPGSRVAVVGENGRGKSTLLHVLAGGIAPDSGTVYGLGTLGLAEQQMAAAPGDTVGRAVAEAIARPLAALAELERAASQLAADAPGAEAHYARALADAEACDAWDAERRVLVALEALDAETNAARPLAELSVGQRYRVRLACLLGADDDFLLLDEPTNHLDRSGLDFLTTQLRDRQGGIVLVTHDRALLADVAETIIDLDPSPDGRPRTYGNGYPGYRAGRAALQASWEQAHTREQAERARLSASLESARDRLVSGWRPDKGTNKHQRATRAGGLVQSVHRRHEQLEAWAVTVPEPPQSFRFPELPVHDQPVLLAVDGVSVAARLAGPVSCALSRRGRLLVAGPNGAGKSTLLAVAAGDLVPDTGAATRAPGVRLGYVRQESQLPAEGRADEVFAAHSASLVSAGAVTESDVVALPELGLLRPNDLSKRVGELSMGQQRRLDLALVLAARPHVLLLDEPSNHLSITLVDELTDALRATEAAVVLATHDRQLLRDVRGWPRLDLAP